MCLGFDCRFWVSYGKVFDDLRSSPKADVRCAVLSSGLDRIFTAGLDSEYTLSFKIDLVILRSAAHEKHPQSSPPATSSPPTATLTPLAPPITYTTTSAPSRRQSGPQSAATSRSLPPCTATSSASASTCPRCATCGTRRRMRALVSRWDTLVMLCSTGNTTQSRTGSRYRARCGYWDACISAKDHR